MVRSTTDLATYSELIQQLAHQRRRGDVSPLAMLRALDPSPAASIAHLPIANALSQAWYACAGEPFRPHQAHALGALRRGDPVVFQGGGAAIWDSFALLSCVIAGDDPHSTALILLPHEQNVAPLVARLNALAAAVPARYQLPATGIIGERDGDPRARCVVTTADRLHDRLLRNHERGWRGFWRGLSIISIADLDHSTGVRAAHLSDLLFRLQRIALIRRGRMPLILGSIIMLDGCAAALQPLLGQPWRIVPADDGGHDGGLLAVWQSEGARLRDISEIADATHRRGLRTHILCSPIERAALVPSLGDLDGVHIGQVFTPADVLIYLGAPPANGLIRRWLHDGCRMMVIVLGGQPHEIALASQTESLLRLPWTLVPPPPPNTTITARHVLCAAAETPLGNDEIEAWGAGAITDRLLALGCLVEAPGLEPSWRPAPGFGDPHEDLDLQTADGRLVSVRAESGQDLGQIDAAAYERWSHVGAALPPLSGGMHVIASDPTGELRTVRLEHGGRRTLPLRRCSLTVRDERGANPHDRSAWGRVTVDETVYAYREAMPYGDIATHQLPVPRVTVWNAPACWIELGEAVEDDAQLTGWCVVGAVAASHLCQFVDLVPVFEAATRRLYLVDAHPGGNGLAREVFVWIATLLPMALEVADACIGDPLLAVAAQRDRTWLAERLGRLPAALHADAVPVTPPAAGAAGASVAAQLLEQIRRHPPRVAEERPADRVPPPAEAALAPFAAGDRVQCPWFGIGTIVAVQQEDDRLMLNILFDESGPAMINPRERPVIPITREGRERRGR